MPGALNPPLTSPEGSAALRIRLLSACFFILIGLAPCCGQESDSLQLGSLFLPEEALPPIFPGLAPQMIGPQQWELLLFNPMTTFKLEDSRDINNITTSRNTLITHLLQANYGLIPSRRLNLGMEVQYGHSRSDSLENSSPFRALGNDETTGASFHSFSMVGFRLRAMPIGTLPELTLQSSILFPIGKDSLHRAALGRQRMEWATQLSFYQHFTPWLYAYFQVDGIIQFKNEQRRQTTYTTPVSVMVVTELWERRIYFYPGLSYIADFQKQFKGSLRKVRHFWYLNLGLQGNIGPRLSLVFQWQYAFGINDGGVVTSIVPGSLQSWSLGVRALLGK